MIHLYESSNEFTIYLKNHIKYVKQCYFDILRPYILKDFDANTDIRCQEEINSHDQSKYSDKEYYAYANIFSGTKDNGYDYAVLDHYHKNRHHWQYWCLLKDTNTIIPLDMPIECIIAMLCDWHSFSINDIENTAAKWYENNKNNMLLSDNTKKIISKYLKYLNKPLVIEAGDNND